MTQTIASLLSQDFAANQLDAVYNNLLDRRLADNWELYEEDNRMEMGEQFDRHSMMLTDNHTIAVTMDWIHQLMTDALSFLTKTETDKYVRNLYLARLAIDDMFVGAAYHDLTCGDKVGPDALVEILGLVQAQINHDLGGAITTDGNYTLKDARWMADELWYFASAGLIGIPTNNLAYGCNVLVADGRYQRPRALVNTGDLSKNLATVAALDELL